MLRQYVLDEPTNHLDVEGRERLEAELMKSGVSCLMTTHDRRMLRTVGTRFLVIEKGRLKPVDSPSSFLGRANARPMTGSVAVSKDGLQYRFVIPGSKYPPAEPGALGIGPLEAAVRVADAALHSLATRRWPISATNSFGPSGRPLAPGS